MTSTTAARELSSKPAATMCRKCCGARLLIIALLFSAILVTILANIGVMRIGVLLVPKLAPSHQQHYKDDGDDSKTLWRDVSQSIDCQQQLQNITVVREIGRGVSKVSYEVVLPSGRRVAAKRCLSRSCESRYHLFYEATLFSALYAQDPLSAIPFFGICTFSWWPFSETEDALLNFERGTTLFLALGEPVTSTLVKQQPFRRARFESLIALARMYDQFKGGAIEFVRTSDSKLLKQYVMIGDSVYHIDLFGLKIHSGATSRSFKTNCEFLMHYVGGISWEEIAANTRVNCTTSSASSAAYIALVSPHRSRDTTHGQPTRATKLASTPKTLSTVDSALNTSRGLVRIASNKGFERIATGARFAMTAAGSLCPASLHVRIANTTQTIRAASVAVGAICKLAARQLGMRFGG